MSLFRNKVIIYEDTGFAHQTNPENDVYLAGNLIQRGTPRGISLKRIFHISVILLIGCFVIARAYFRKKLKR